MISLISVVVPASPGRVGPDDPGDLATTERNANQGSRREGALTCIAERALETGMAGRFDGDGDGLRCGHQSPCPELVGGIAASFNYAL